MISDPKPKCKCVQPTPVPLGCPFQIRLSWQPLSPPSPEICLSSMRRLSGYLGLAELEPESKSPPAPLVAAPAPAAAAGAPDFSLVSDPAGGYAAAVGAGSKKAQASAGKVFGLGILAGTHIGFGAYLAVAIGAACPGLHASNPGLQKMVFGAFGLPFGLFMISMTGAELYTGNAALVPMAWLEGKATAAQVVRNLGGVLPAPLPASPTPSMSPATLPLCPHSPEPDGAIYSAPLPPHSTASWAGNLLGSILLAALVTTGGTLGEAAAAQKIAFGKTHEPLLVVLVRAVLCNWLVCMATYMSLQAKDTTGKFVAIWLPISAFVALGLEHTGSTHHTPRPSALPRELAPHAPHIRDHSRKHVPASPRHPQRGGHVVDRGARPQLAARDARQHRRRAPRRGASLLLRLRRSRQEAPRVGCPAADLRRRTVVCFVAHLVCARQRRQPGHRSRVRGTPLSRARCCGTCKSAGYHCAMPRPA